MDTKVDVKTIKRNPRVGDVVVHKDRLYRVDEIVRNRFADHGPIRIVCVYGLTSGFYNAFRPNEVAVVAQSELKRLGVS